MTLRQFAFNNVLRNRRMYAAYFLSSAFSVMVFFTYSMFAFHPSLSGASIHKNVISAMHFAESVIYVFSFFFVLYSMSAFLKSRKREFGVLVMHGMTNMQLRRLVFTENMLIGFGATVFGVSIGLVFSKLILLLAQNVLKLEMTLPFYLPKTGLLLTFAAFMALFFVISLFTVSVLRGHKLIDLIKGTAKPKPEPKASVWLSWLAALLLAGGYAAALWAKGTVVFFAMIPVTVVVIIGTYFLFTQLSVYIINKSKGRRQFFWRGTNLILLSDLAYRMKDNARTFFMVAILSTVAFSAIGSLVGFKYMYTNSIKDENPFAMEYQSRSGNPDALAARHVETIESALKQAGLDFRKYEAAVRYVTPTSGKPVPVVRASDFNAIAEAAGEQKAAVKENQAVLVHYTNPLAKRKPGTGMAKLTLSGVELQPVQSLPSHSLKLYQDYYIVDDGLFGRLSQIEKTDRFYAFDVKNAGNLRSIGEQLSRTLDGDAANGKFQFLSLDYTLYQVDQAYGSILFIGLFIGIVFFVGAGSFLYFRLYTDLEEDKRKFQAIRKLGLSDSELSGILTRQIMILFFIPILVAVIHGGIALTALQHLFNYNLASQSAMVLGTFILIQIAYFLLIRSRYIANVKHG